MRISDWSSDVCASDLIVLRSLYPRIRPNLPPSAYVVLTRRSGPAGTGTMAKITKRVVDAAETGSKDYVIWDDELPGFGLRVFASGKRSYVIQYRSRGRSRRYTIGLHGVWSPETARRADRKSKRLKSSHSCATR